MTEAKLIDCMEYMKTVPDKYFDLAVVDPPYGGGGKAQGDTALVGGGTEQWATKDRSRFGGWFDRYFDDNTGGGTVQPIRADRTGGTWAKRYQSADYL